jgi:HlyD family secretion protein
MTKKKKTALIVIAALLIAAIAIKLLWKSPFRYAGTLEATRVDVPARVSTVLTTVAVEEGQQVKQGAKIASLSCDELRISGRLATENYDRALKLRKVGSLSQEAYDQTASAKQDSDARLSWCEVYAPVSGTILSRFVEPSEWVNPGTKLVAMANISDIWAYIYVPQKVMSRLKTGLEVQGRIPELGDRTYKGIIRKINDEAEFTPKNVQTQAERTRLIFGIKIYFENQDQSLNPGMTIEVQLPEG